MGRFNNIKISLVVRSVLLTATLLLPIGKPLFGITITCALPVQVDKKAHASDYIKLSEPKTIIELDNSKRVSRFFTPGCSKFQSISTWSNNFSIECTSYNLESVTLKVNTKKLKFSKTYIKNQVNNRHFSGFCKKYVK